MTPSLNSCTLTSTRNGTSGKVFLQSSFLHKPWCCTRSCNVYNVWQQNYWEHIIRDENELNKIRVYIRNNPLKWQDDKLNDDRINVIQEETGRGEKYYAPNEEW